jgi:zinc protease
MSCRVRPFHFPRRAVAGLVALGVVVAACTTDAGIDTERADSAAPATEAVDSAPADSDPPPATSAESDGTDRSAATVETTPPDPEGLPVITEADPEVRIGELDNGLRYFIRRNDNPGARVEMRLAVDAGSALQDDEQGGGAHFLEHMLFNGTEQFPGNELVDVLRSFGAAFGADINAFTSYDETVYQLTMPTDDQEIVETGLDVLEQWLTSATISPDAVVDERGVVLDEWRGSEQSSSGRIFNELEDLFLAGSPYEGKDPIGTDTEIENTVDAPLRGYYDDWYRPDNTAVVVVGDIDPDTIEAEIKERFESADSRGSSPERPILEVTPSTVADARVLADPDVAAGFAFVNLPLAVAQSGSVEEDLQHQILTGLAFDIIATRLSNDALRGDAPFDTASVDSSSFVRGLDAPEILVDADGPDLEAAVQAVIDEYERVRRFGFTEAEVARAVSASRSAAQAAFDASGSRQDASFADEYVRHTLEGEPIPTAERTFEFWSEVLDRADPPTVAHVFIDRFTNAGAHAMVVVPEDESDDVPSAEVFLEMLDSVGERDLEPRADEEEVGDELMAPPDPADVVDVEALGDGFVEPVALVFDNGVQVGLTVTSVVEGTVAFEARSPGGLAVVDDELVPDAQAAAEVVGGSGVGEFDAAALDAFLADKEVGLTPFIDQYFEGFQGGAATTDLETLFQLVHLMITEPRVDPVILDRYLGDELALAEDPSVDPSYAEFDALLRARYDDPRYLLPTEDSLAEVDSDDIDTVFRDRFGDSTDFAFTLTGDFDLDEARDLAARYLGTLPADGRIDDPGFVEPPPPAGVIIEDVGAGDGEQANVSVLHTAEARADRREEVTATIVGDVISNRLTDTIREELGESYSPFGVVELTEGPLPNAETYVAVSTAPDLLEAVSESVHEQLADLRDEGPTESEFEAASAAARRQLELFSNPQVNDEVLRVLLDPTDSESFEEFYGLSALAAAIGIDEVESALRRWLPPDHYIEVRVRPR